MKNITLGRQRSKWFDILERRKNFLLARVEKRGENKQEGDWDLHEAHALEWAIKTITELYKLN